MSVRRLGPNLRVVGVSRVFGIAYVCLPANEAQAEDRARAAQPSRTALRLGAVVPPSGVITRPRMPGVQARRKRETRCRLGNTLVLSSHSIIRVTKGSICVI
jgi:hypothetical protein